MGDRRAPATAVAKKSVAAARGAPESVDLVADALFSLQRAAGNRAVRRLIEDAGAINEAARRGTLGASGALPYLGRIQRSFGRHHLRPVKAHTHGNAAA